MTNSMRNKCSVESCKKPSHGKGYCQQHYNRWRIHGDPLKYKRLHDLTLKERFDEKWEPVTESGCWIWTASVDRHGYGELRVDGKTKKAHRIAYELYNEPIPKGDDYHGICVLHKCDTPSCVNPNHLFLGTQIDNIDDMKMKGRDPKGEAQSNSKLKENQVIKIRQLFAEGKTSQHKLSKMFDIHQSTISRIISGDRWSHV